MPAIFSARAVYFLYTCACAEPADREVTGRRRGVSAHARAVSRSLRDGRIFIPQFQEEFCDCCQDFLSKHLQLHITEYYTALVYGIFNYHFNVGGFGYIVKARSSFLNRKE